MKTKQEIQALSREAYRNYPDKEEMQKDRKHFIYGYQLAQTNMLKYKKAYNILHSYFDSIGSEEQKKVVKQLGKLNL